MGCYLYSVRKSDPLVARIGDEWVDVLRLRYLRNPHHDSSGPDGITRMLAGKAWAVWEGEDLTGRYVVECGDGDPDPGARVWRWSRHQATWDDCSDIPGEFVGLIEPFKNVWRVRRMTEERLSYEVNLAFAEKLRAGTASHRVDGEWRKGPEAADAYVATLVEPPVHPPRL